MGITSEVFQSCRDGSFKAVKASINGLNVNDRDANGLTALHWAVYGDHFEICKYLLDAGADINCLGGDPKATPILWAVSNIRIKLVDLLISYGADIYIPDGQGFRMLHVAVQSRNSLMLSYLLHALPTEYVDIVDTNGRSALMLAVYQGDLTFVKILLKFNASVNVQDSEGFSALHWAAVQGKATLFEILLQNGANDSVRNDKSLTAENLSMELGSHKEFKLAKNRSQIFNHKFLAPFILYIFPSLMMFATSYLIARYPFFISIPSVFSFVYLTQIINKGGIFITTQGLYSGILPGIGIGTIIIIFFAFIYVATTDVLLVEILFLGLSELAIYIYMMKSDPGYVKPLNGKTERLQQIKYLMTINKFDREHWDPLCSVQKPMRSGLCFQCGNVVQRRDHHCPWTYNCIGRRNHISFIGYLVLAVISVVHFSVLFVNYFQTLSIQESPACYLLSGDICEKISRAPLLLVAWAWSLVVGLWIVIILVSQVFQISANFTSLEVLRLQKDQLLSDDRTKNSSCARLDFIFGLKIVRYTIRLIMDKQLHNRQSLYNKGLIKNWQEFLSSL